MRDLGSLTHWLLASGGSLSTRVIRGGLWLTLGDALARLCALARIVIMARLLSSYDFGLFGIGLFTLGWIERVTTLGMSPALIRQPGDVRPYLDTAWTSQALRGAGLAVLLVVAGAPLVAALFATPDASAVVRALAPAVLLRGLTNPAMVLVSRELDFRRIVAWNLCQSAAGLLSAVLFGLVLGNVWALVGSVLAGEVVRTATSYWIVPDRPRPRLDVRRLRELGQFGKWVLLYRMARAFGATVDSLLVGRMLGPAALGLYQMAGRIAFPLTHEIGALVSRVMLPGFARVDGRENLRDAFSRVLHVAVAVILPLGTFLGVYGSVLSTAVLGAAWSGSARLLPVLAGCGVARALSGVTGPLFHVTGRPDIPARTAMAGTLLAAVAGYPLTRAFGMSGTAVAVLAGAVLTITLDLRGAFRLLQVPWSQHVRTFRTGLVGALPFLAGALPFGALHWGVALGVGGVLYALLMLGVFGSYARVPTGRALPLREPRSDATP